MGQLETTLAERSGGVCELCGSTDDLQALDVYPADGTSNRAIWACVTCRDQAEERADLDGKHWFCLQESIWSEHSSVQVTSWRLLHRLGEHSWATDLLDQAYLADDVMEWAQEGLDANAVKVVDSNGTQLADGDSVTLIKDLDVKGANFTAKRGTMVKNIRLGDDPGLVEGRVNGTAIYLKVEFLKKA